MADNSSHGFLPGGVPSLLRFKPGHYIAAGKGCLCWDQEGNEYIDFSNGYGAILLGHAHEELNEAVFMQMQRGTLFPSYSPLYDELQAALIGYFPWHKRCLFLKTGSEAVAASLRLARAFSGKEKIIRCGFHGWHDEMMATHFGWHSYDAIGNTPYIPPGIPASSASNIFCWDGESMQGLAALFHQNKSEVAALILDPVQLKEPLGENLESIRRLVHAEGALLIIDELKTGFRVNMGGVQGLYGQHSDLTILGKGLSNGFPLAVVLGSEEIIQLVPKVKIMGTFNNELLSVVAALKTLDILEKSNGIDHFWKIGNDFITKVNELVGHLGLSHYLKAVPYRWSCLPYLLFSGNFENIQNARALFYQNIVENGLLFLSGHMNFITLAHDIKNIENALESIEKSLIFCMSNENRNYWV